MLLCTGTRINIQSFVGLIMAGGVASANAILLTSFAERIRQQGKPAVEAGLEAAQLRLRPLLMTSFALTWLSVALGLVAKTVESASNLPMFLTLLPFLGSGFVPTASMPIGLRWFAEYQPFTPVTETVRGLLVGGPVGGHALVSAAWAVGIALVSYVWAKRLYNRGPQLPR